jgi:hypothetical protein
MNYDCMKQWQEAGRIVNVMRKLLERAEIKAGIAVAEVTHLRSELNKALETEKAAGEALNREDDAKV